MTSVERRHINAARGVTAAVLTAVTILFMSGELPGLAAVEMDASARETEYFTERDLDASWDAGSAQRIALDDLDGLATAGAYELDGDLCIVSKGTYVLSGAMETGHRIIVDAGKVRLQIVLDGAAVENEDLAPLYVKQADKVFLTLAENSENILALTGNLREEETAREINAALYSRDDLTINGTGSLRVTAAGCSGIRSSDDLVIAGGTIEVSAGKNGFVGHDSLRICGGTIGVTAGNDGLKANNDKKGKGYVVITGGNAEIAAGGEGIHADGNLIIDGGGISITESREGLEAPNITVNGGDISVTSSEDGINAAGGKGGSTLSAMRPGETGTDEDTKADIPFLGINGGTVYVDAGGDGLDSNGDIVINGGYVIVDGPPNSGDGALDPGTENGGEMIVNGGTVIASGASETAVSFGAGSAQCSVNFTLSENFSEGDALTITGEDGGVLTETVLGTSGNSVIFSCPDLKEGETCTLKAGEASCKAVSSLGPPPSGGPAAGGRGGGLPAGDAAG